MCWQSLIINTKFVQNDDLKNPETVLFGASVFSSFWEMISRWLQCWPQTPAENRTLLPSPPLLTGELCRKPDRPVGSPPPCLSLLLPSPISSPPPLPCTFYILHPSASWLHIHRIQIASHAARPRRKKCCPPQCNVGSPMSLEQLLGRRVRSYKVRLVGCGTQMVSSCLFLSSRFKFAECFQ